MFHRQLPISRAFLLCGLLVLGFAGGRMMRSHPAGETRAEAAEDISPPPATPFGRSATPAGEAAAWSPMPDLRSTDTVEVLAALHEDELYERLALWLVDASVEDMAAWWSATKENEDLHFRFRDLVFMRWTALDPAGAVGAAAGTPYEHIPWWAWAKNDSDAAFREAMMRGGDRVGWVLRSIGQKDPERALRLLDEHPDLEPSTGLDGIVFGLTSRDPEAAVVLQHERGGGFDSTALEAWLRDDPHAAFDWFLRQRQEFGAGYPDGRQQALIEALARENPELLGEFAAGLPAGALRRELEAAAFDHLLATEPERALATAADHPSPHVATRQLAKAALAADDPAVVRGVLSQILKINPNPLHDRHPIHVPGGQSMGGRTNDECALLMGRMIADDPHGLLDALLAADPEEPWTESAEHAASLWMARDPDAFGAWASGLEDENLRVKTLRRFMEYLRYSGDYRAAMRHAAMLPDGLREQELQLIEDDMKLNSPEGLKTRPGGNEQ